MKRTMTAKMTLLGGATALALGAAACNDELADEPVQDDTLEDDTVEDDLLLDEDL